MRSRLVAFAHPSCLTSREETDVQKQSRHERVSDVGFLLVFFFTWEQVRLQLLLLTSASLQDPPPPCHPGSLGCHHTHVRVSAPPLPRRLLLDDRAPCHVRAPVSKELADAAQGATSWCCGAGDPRLSVLPGT
eukprot:757895-Hanusia_phi.AAC.1